jgi:hypothetical protein
MVSAERSIALRQGWSGKLVRASQPRQKRVVAASRAFASSMSAGTTSSCAQLSAQ